MYLTLENNSGLYKVNYLLKLSISCIKYVDNIAPSTAVLPEAQTSCGTYVCNLMKGKMIDHELTRRGTDLFTVVVYGHDDSVYFSYSLWIRPGESESVLSTCRCACRGN